MKVSIHQSALDNKFRVYHPLPNGRGPVLPNVFETADDARDFAAKNGHDVRMVWTNAMKQPTNEPIDVPLKGLDY